MKKSGVANTVYPFSSSDYWIAIDRAITYSRTITVENVTSRLSFYAAFSRYACMPHIVNSRVLGAKLCSDGDRNFLETPISYEDLEDIDNEVEENNCNETKDFQSCQNGYFILRRKTIVKNLKEYVGQEIWDFKNDCIKLYQPMISLTGNDDSVGFVILCGQLFHDEENPTAALVIKANTDDMIVSEILPFYEGKVIPKIAQWMGEEKCSSPYSSPHIPKCSLQLIDKSNYWHHYQSLKKYYAPLSDMWTKLEESTQPQKMVHEEMAIAAYLTSLSQHPLAKDDNIFNFVDLGCGNGLLSLFLTLKGFEGRGIDLRRRKLWKLFDEFSVTEKNRHLSLLECTILPQNAEFSKENPNTWLIGNHSDELTPWIPIWARQNNLNFFILPCCSYDFSAKFQRKKGNKNTSVFSSYILHIKDIIEKCGYVCYIDRLQIPSTKRISLIGLIKHSNSRKKEEIKEYIDTVFRQHSKAFKIREGQERVQNCTRLKCDESVDVVGDMAKCILDELVSVKNYILQPEYSKPWNRGMEKLSLKDAADLLSEKHRELLKNQGKGICTLMKNYSKVFSVSDGFISLRPPSKTDIVNVSSSKTGRINTKQCFLELNHPDGCPLQEQWCSYKHSIS